MNQTIFTMHHISKEKVPSIVDKLNSEDFIYYSGYPSIIYNLALIIEELNLQITNQSNNKFNSFTMKKFILLFTLSVFWIADFWPAG